MVLNPIGPLQGGDGVDKINAFGKEDGTSRAGAGQFKQFLVDSLEHLNQLQADSEAAQEALVTHQTDDVSQVMSAVEKADIAFNTMMAVRNKLIEAYQEVLRMQI